MIRSSKHTLKYLNANKSKNLDELIHNYRILTQQIIDYIWINGYMKFNIKTNKLDCTSLIDSSFLKKFTWSYTERLKQAAGKQALIMISAATEKRRKQLFQLKKLQKSGSTFINLQKAISIYPLIKPNASKINLELDSRFVDFKFNNQNKFSCFVRLTSIKNGINIKIPIVKSPVFDKWNLKGKLKKSIRITPNNIFLLFDINDCPLNGNGEVIGCDQGITDILTFSKPQTIQKYQNKYTLSDVQKILSRKQKGSKAFKRAQEFRKNIINWSINQYDFSNIKELRLEKLHNVRKGKTQSRFLSHWTYTLINDKLTRISQEKGFLIKKMPNEFRSQRCSKCGWVRKANRKGKTFSCNKCNYVLDADLNAASNLLLDLYEIPFWVRLKKINRQGFYWNHDALLSESQEQIVPGTKKE